MLRSRCCSCTGCSRAVAGEDCVGLAVFTTLTLGESIYPLAAIAILVLVLLAVPRRRAPKPLLVRCCRSLSRGAAWILGAAWLVLGPYLTRDKEWDLLLA